jgi:hypothetical protein
VLWNAASFFANALFSETLCVRGESNLRSRCAGPSVLRRPAHQSLKHHQSKGQHRAVRPSAASAPLRVRAQEFGGLSGHGQCFSTQGNTRSSPRPCEYAAPAPLRSSAMAGIGRAAYASGGVGSIRRMQMPQALRSRNRCAEREQNTVTANPSIERTNNGGRFCAASAAVCTPLFAAHVER